MRRRAAALLLLLGLPACTVWVRPGATRQEADATVARCEAISRTRVPPALYTVQTSSAYRAPVERRCRTDSAGRETCTTTGGDYHPATYGQRDANGGTRDAVFRDCMFSHGFHPE